MPRSISWRMRIHSRSTRGSAFSAHLRASSFVSGFAFPDKELVLPWPAFGWRAGNSFDITADSFDDFPVGHGVVNVPCGVF